jgi:SAM-dependent methyltransferase
MLLTTLYPEVTAGGFTRVDGTIQFFIRVVALISSSDVVLDFGAGRGRLAHTGSKFKRGLVDLRNVSRKVIAVDIDPAVLENTTSHEQHLIVDGKIPLPDNSVDLIVADNVFEHIERPADVVSELCRVLKRGGWICARTPHTSSVVAIAARLVPNRLHARIVSHVQPNQREDRDVFPTVYQLNSRRALRKHFPIREWNHCSYTWDPEPAYHFNSRLIASILRIFQYLKRPLDGEVLMIFLQKKPAA